MSLITLSSYISEHLHEVWEVSIPAKLIAGKDAGLTKNRDFSLLTAGYTGNLVKQVRHVCE